MPQLDITEVSWDTVSQLQASTLFLHSRGIQLFQKMWTRHRWDPHWNCVQGRCSYHWANCPNYVHCYNTEHCHGDFEHWGDPNLTVHKWTSELLVHSSFSTIACLSDALDWHHSSTGRADGCHLLQSLTSPFSDNCDSPPADDKFCRRVSHCSSTDCFQQAVLWPLLDHWGTGRKHGTEQLWKPYWLWHSAAIHCQRDHWSIGSWAELQPTLWKSLQRTCWSLHSHWQSTSTDLWWHLHWMHLEEYLHWWLIATQEEDEQGNCSRRDCSYWLHWQGQCGDHWSSN